MLRLERVFVLVFAIDTIIKVLFHFNGHKVSNEKMVLSSDGDNQIEETNDSSQNKVYIQNDRSVVHLLSNKIVILDVILNSILILLFLLPLEPDSGVI